MSAMSDDLNDSAGSPLLSPSLSVSREQDSPDRNRSSGRKRAAMASSEEEPAKRQAVSGANGGQDVMFRVLCPANRVGSVIGKGGAVIEQIRKESRAKVQVVESRGDAEFRVIIISSPAATGEEWSPAQEALFSIHRRIVEGDPSDQMDVAATVVRLLVPGSQIGCLLGKGGAVISKLREESGAGIKVMGGDQLPRCAHPTDEMVMVSGELSAAQKALRDVSERMRAFPPRDLPHGPPQRRHASNLPLPPPPPPPAGRPPVLPHPPPTLPLPRLETSVASLPIHLPLLSLAALGVPAGGDVVFRILFPISRIGGLIGKAGTIIKQLRMDTGTRITVEPAVDGCDEQVVEIQGPEVEGAPLCGAQEALFQVAAHFAAAEPGPTRLLVPTTQVGCLLGKGGSIIQDLRRQSTASIRIMPRNALPKCARPSDELVQVAGSPDSVHAALLLIAGRIRANPLRETPPRGDRHTSDRGDGKDRERERDGGRRPDDPSSERYVQHDEMDEDRAAEYEKLRRSHEREKQNQRERERGHDRERDQGRERERDRDRERQRDGGRERGRERDRDRDRERDRDYDRRREPIGDRLGARSRQEDNSGGRGRHEERHSNGHAGAHHAPSMHDRWPVGAGSSLLSGPTSSLHISVPRHAVGSIIGKRGSNIEQIRQISGAKVKLHDAESKEASVRMLEICGTMEQTQMAQGLLQTILQDASLNGGLERPR